MLKCFIGEIFIKSARQGQLKDKAMKYNNHRKETSQQLLISKRNPAVCHIRRSHQIINRNCSKHRFGDVNIHVDFFLNLENTKLFR